MNFMNVIMDTSGGSIIAFNKETFYSLIFQLANTILLVAILAFILYLPVRKFMASRSEKISGDIDDAKKTKEEALLLKKEYEEKIIAIEEERQGILADAHAKALERSDHILKQAKEEAEYLNKTANAEIKEQQRSVEEEIKRQLVELSVMIAGKFIEDSMDEEIHDKYINEALDSWEEGLWLD